MTSQRIKLQLFPINESTRTGLEKDGHNPHLELTLRLNKKISSVIKHVNKKWGSSSVASGELVLFPHDSTESEMCYPFWNSNSDMITAQDVYSVVGNPSVFRLRYGWFPEIPQSIYFNPKSGHVEECALLNTDITCIEPEQLEDENRRDDDVSIATPALWIGDEDEISVSALFNEASLQAKLRNGEPGPKRENGLLESVAAPDSFDASVAAQSDAHSQLSNMRPPLRHSPLDAGITSGEFLEPRFLLSPEFIDSSLFTASGTDSQGAVLVPSHHPTEIQQDHSPEPKEDIFFIEHPCEYDGGNHNLAGIHWPESVNQFDFHFPTPWGYFLTNGGENSSRDVQSNQLPRDDL